MVEKYFGLQTSLFRVMTASLCIKTSLVEVFLSFGHLNDLILHNMITLNGLNDFLVEEIHLTNPLYCFISSFYAKFGFKRFFHLRYLCKAMVCKKMVRCDISCH